MKSKYIYEPVEVVNIKGISKDKWLEYRRKGIGGSDVAAIFACSPFMTLKDLYYDKLGMNINKQSDNNWVAKEVGHRLEGLVAEIFAKKTSYKIIKTYTMFSHPHNSFMLADIDFFVVTKDGEKGVLECKTSNIFNKEKWENDSIPYNYELQVRHYMAVTNLNFAFIACLFSNNESDFIIRKLERNYDDEIDIINIEKEFWYEYVQKKIEPPYMESDDLVVRSINQYYSKLDTNSNNVEIETSYMNILEQINELKTKKLNLDKQSREIEKQIKNLYIPIIEIMGDSCKAICKTHNKTYEISYKPTFRTSILKENLEIMKLTDTDIYNKYVNVTENRTFSIKLKNN